jgi:hypothetical protein
MMIADRDVLAVLHASIAVGERVDHLAEAAESRAVAFNVVVAPSRLAIEAHAVFRRLAAPCRHQHAALQVFESRHPQAAVEAAGDPAGHADVVRVHVRDQDARDALAAQRTRRTQQGAPRLGGVDGAEAVSTTAQPLPSRNAQRLMWSRRNGIGMRIHSTPGAISRASPTDGGIAARVFERAYRGCVFGGVHRYASTRCRRR